VTPAARSAFETALKDPESAPRSRYYLALAQLQQGDAKGALDAWRKLEAESPTTAEYLPLLRQRIAEAEAALAGASGKSGTPAAANVTAAAKAAESASPEQRQAMIRGMVDRLAARLAAQPDDAEGWTRLGRSYMVLNEPAKARDAYAHAAKLKPDALPVKQAYAEAIVAAAGQDASGPPADAVTLYRDILAADPKNQEALWYVGITEAAAGHRDTARDLLSRLLAQLPDDAPARRAVTARLAALTPEK
jgi:cytochrome c-type biogenesis protein CcmH